MKRLLVAVALLCISSMWQVAEAGVLFRLPLASNPGITSWFDRNSAAGSLLRYDCSTSFSYDDHHGIDFATPTGTAIYAGATGSLYDLYDGCPDTPDQYCGGGFGNHAKVSHSLDGHVTIYAHMKQGTVVYFSSFMCGAYIGQSGNSGRSSGPHLHFELWSDRYATQRLDFFGGACGGPSYWVNQNGGSPTTACQ